MTTVTDAQVDAVPGWFPRLDIEAFRLLLEATSEELGRGDLAELGTYVGKSAVLIGGSVRLDETFTVVDLFDSPASESDNLEENARHYVGLTRSKFESNYLRVHGRLPVVIEGPSHVIVDHAARGTHRFVHIDASHLYEHVVVDIASAATLLMESGIVVLDDYRGEHTPGVAAAAWQAVDRGLQPFLLTPQKMYATWGDHERWFDVVGRWAAGPDVSSEIQRIGSQPAVRVWRKGRWVKDYLPPAALQPMQRALARAKRAARG